MILSSHVNTFTYADIESLRALYDQALAEPDVIGLAVGTRPDCVPAPVLDLLAGYQQHGHEIWLQLGVDGLKLHPLHVVKGTQLANEWRRGEYQPLLLDEYINIATDLIRYTPPEVIFHRVTATASKQVLLAPDWCSQKWLVINRITEALRQRSRTPSCCMQTVASCPVVLQ